VQCAEYYNKLACVASTTEVKRREELILDKLEYVGSLKEECISQERGNDIPRVPYDQ
jgi:hypothetical protein